MCTAGFYRRQTLHAGMMAWNTLLAQARPDLVVADHTPLLLLACFGRRPVVQVADGFTMPPAEAAAFPMFRQGRKPVDDPAHVRRGMPSLQKPPRQPLPRPGPAPPRHAPTPAPPPPRPPEQR